MKILFISPTYQGGIGGLTKRVADKLTTEGFDIELMHVPHIPIKNLKTPSFTILGTLMAKLNTKEYDVVHAWTISAGIVSQHIKAKKKVLAVNGIYGEQIKLIHSKALSNIGKKAQAKAFKIADTFTTDSMHVKEHYKNQGIDFTRLPNILDTSKLQEIPDVKKKNQVIYIGRDSYEKGIDILKKIEKDINADVVYCTNLPWIETMKKLKESKILIVPSRMESSSTVIKEAFFLKVPVVACDVGGISESVNGDTGILVPPEDPKTLTLAINNLLKDTELTFRLTDNAERLVNRYNTWGSISHIYVNFYKNLFN